jgi:uncharacterized protein YjbI with pentapeptide repeats
MQIIQPLDLESGFRTFTFRDKHHLVVSTKLYFPLLGGDPVLFSEAYGELSALPEPVNDEGLPKINPEFIVAGCAQAPNGKEVSALPVEVSLANLKKNVHVVGDRYWLGGLTGTSQPVPFTEMPLTWNNAFGGKDFDQNPNGKGINKAKTDLGEELISMPNVEFSSQLLTSTSQRPTPAGFMPVLIDHPTRQTLLGTYDDSWLANDFPGYPKDLNLRAFNSTYPDQQLSAKLKGQEPFSISNMHHDHSVLEGQLPDFRVRAFVLEAFDELSSVTEHDLREIQLEVDTVIFYPNQLMGTCIYRGTIEVDHPQAKNIKHLISAYENKQDVARDKSHYLRSFVGRLHPELNMQYALTTKDLIPDTIPCGMARLTQQEENPEQLLAQHLEARFNETVDEKTGEAKQQLLDLIEQYKQEGKDTAILEEQLHNLMNPPKDEWQLKFEAVIAKLTPTLDDGKTIDLQKIDFRAFDELSKLSEEYAQFKKESAMSNMDEQIQQALDSDNRALVELLNQARERFELPPELPRPSDYKATLKQLSESNELLPDDQKLDLADLETKLIQGHEAQIEGYRMGAHMQDTGTPPLAKDRAELQAKVNKIIEEGGTLAFMDLAGLDFSGMDLRGVDFSDCYLEQCNFQRSNLERAVFQRTIACRCDFNHANLTQADLTQANIGGSSFHYANLDYAISKDCEFGKADFSHASLKQLDISHALNTLEVNFHKADVTGVNFGSGTYLETDFSGANFTDSHCEDATFNQCNLARIHGKQSTFVSCNFIECKMESLEFSKSDFTNSRFLNETNLSNTIFDQCILSDVSAREIKMEYIQFVSCTLNRSDFSDSNLSRSNFNGSHCLNSLFIGTDLTFSQLNNANLMASNLMQANLTEASIRHSNLYGCEFLGTIVGKTDFSRSNLDGSKLENWRPSKWQ